MTIGRLCSFTRIKACRSRSAPQIRSAHRLPPSTYNDQLDGRVSSTKNSGHMDTRQRSDEKESEINGDFNGRRDNCRSISVSIQDVWELQVKLEEQGDLSEIEWNL
jgi:hypothetical protein